MPPLTAAQIAHRLAIPDVHGSHDVARPPARDEGVRKLRVPDERRAQHDIERTFDEPIDAVSDIEGRVECSVRVQAHHSLAEFSAEKGKVATDDDALHPGAQIAGDPNRVCHTVGASPWLVKKAGVHRAIRV